MVLRAERADPISLPGVLTNSGKYITSIIFSHWDSRRQICLSFRRPPPVRTSDISWRDFFIIHGRKLGTYDKKLTLVYDYVASLLSFGITLKNGCGLVPPMAIIESFVTFLFLSKTRALHHIFFFRLSLPSLTCLKYKKKHYNMSNLKYKEIEKATENIKPFFAAF